MNDPRSAPNTTRLLGAASQLALAMNKVADDHLTQQLADIVKLHAGIAVASAFIPIPGADVLAAATNIWTMYVRINKELNLPFSENILKSLAAGVATNIGGAAAGMVIGGTIAKFIPGIGSIGGAALMGTAIYGITIAAGIIYMKALATLLANKRAEHISEQDLKSATDSILNDKKAVKDLLKEGRSEYDRNKNK